MENKNNFSVISQYFSSKISLIGFYLLGIILLSVSSKVSIPFFPVPMTLQTFVVYFISATMGMIGFYSTFSYFILGFVGLPIFAKGGGFLYYLEPSFGFLIGMVLASFAIAYLSKSFFNKSIINVIFVSVLGAALLFYCGLTYLTFFFGVEKAVMYGLKPFIYSELLKIALAVSLTYLMIKKN